MLVSTVLYPLTCLSLTNVSIFQAVSICEERQKAEVAEKKVADLQKQVHLRMLSCKYSEQANNCLAESRAHAARIDEEHALETDFNRKKALCMLLYLHFSRAQHLTSLSDYSQ